MRASPLIPNFIDSFLKEIFKRKKQVFQFFTKLCFAIKKPFINKAKQKNKPSFCEKNYGSFSRILDPSIVSMFVKALEKCHAIYETKHSLSKSKG
jgi:hypothetical protein